MNATVAIGIGGAAFLIALGGALWWQAGPAVFSALTAFGLFLCG